MNDFQFRQDRLFCEETPVEAIAGAVGTPFYLYSHRTLARHFQVFDEAFADVPHLICYAVKANSNIALLGIFARAGGGADIVSGGELYRALKAGIPPAKIVRLGAKDNFWGPAGDTGACGPCSELHLDRGETFGPGPLGAEGDARFMEYWNLVFPQFDQQPDGSRPPLQNRGIDTGMGLERMAAILQNK